MPVIPSLPLVTPFQLISTSCVMIPKPIVASAR